MAAAQLQKPFTCYGCGQEIKLQRKDDNSGWIRFEADGHTQHRCERKKQQHQQQPQQPPQSQVVQRPSQQQQQQQHQQIQAQELPLGHQLATLTDVVVRLERRIDLLTEEVQAMRTELLVQQQQQQHQQQKKKKEQEEK
jgi:hypothetical protein